MPTSVLLPTPIREIRQYADAPFVDMVFDTTADRNTYLTSPRRYGGMVVVDKQEQRMYFLNTATNAWIAAAPSGLVKGFGSKQFSIVFDGSAGAGAIGALTIDEIDITPGTFIAMVYAYLDTNLVADDDSAYITVGIESDDPASAIDTPIGLVDNLNANATANVATQILSPSLKRATDNRIIVAAVNGANITEGNMTVILILSNQLVDESGGGSGGALTVRTNSVDNDNQTILDLIDSDTITFEYTGAGQVMAHSLVGLQDLQETTTNGAITTLGIQVSSLTVNGDNPQVLLLTQTGTLGGGFGGSIAFRSKTGGNYTNLLGPDVSTTTFQVIQLPDQAGNILVVNVSDDYANDAAAALGGTVKVGQGYHTSGLVKIRLS